MAKKKQPEYEELAPDSFTFGEPYPVQKRTKRTEMKYKNAYGQEIDVTKLSSGLFSIHRYNLRTGESVRLPGDYTTKQADQITRWFSEAKEPLTWDKNWKSFLNKIGRT
jgi:hypothetical protein